MTYDDQNAVRLSKTFLQAAAIYNLAWGSWVIFRPFDLFDLTGATRPYYVEIWQCLGMVIGVYGIGYWLASKSPLVHWPIVLVGLLGKIFGPLGFLITQFNPSVAPFTQEGKLPMLWGSMLVTNDLIWWPLFAYILYHAIRYNTEPGNGDKPMSLKEANGIFRLADGESLDALSYRMPVLLVFLRHHGCTFCRSTLADLRKCKDDLRAKGVQPVIVHMDARDDSSLFKQYDVAEVPRINDPDCKLYRAYELPRASAYQLLAPIVLWRGFKNAILQRHGFGKPVGDGFQMPGVFLLQNGKIKKEFRHANASEQPDYCAFTSAKTQ